MSEIRDPSPRPLPAFHDLDPERVGAGAEDWLALLLGPPTGPSRELARAMLSRRELGELSKASVAQLVGECGLEPFRARRVVAAFGLARAWQASRRPVRPALESAAAVFETVRGRLRDLEHECFLSLILDARHRLRRVCEVSAGTLTSSLVHPREVFAASIRDGAAAVIVVHNHPSGDPEPSVEDVAVTKRLFEAGELLGIPLLDHVIVVEHDFVSLRERMGSLFAKDASKSVARRGT